MSPAQKEDIQRIFAGFKEAGNLDYVAGWFKKASDFMQGTAIQSAFVSTNSITQGEQVAPLFKPLIEKGIHINFAYPPFVWNSETFEKAKVHCVIIGFSYVNQKEKFLISDKEGIQTVEKINPYLLEGENIFIEKRTKPLGQVSIIGFGNKPIDGGNLLINSEEELKEYLKKEPEGEKFIRPFLGSEEFINNKKRWCFWLVGANPAEMRKLPLLSERVKRVRELRENSPRGATQKLADTPTLFAEIRQPKEGNFLIIPKVSSERREYIPIGFLDSSIIPSDLLFIIPHATLFEFGVLTSSSHMAWMRAFAGRLKSDYRYSTSLVYNTFPWCEYTEAQKAKIEKTAQGILDARLMYPDSSLADLYDVNFMPPELKKAHEANDKAVREAYGFEKGLSEREILVKLMALYREKVEK